MGGVGSRGGASDRRGFLTRPRTTRGTSHPIPDRAPAQSCAKRTLMEIMAQDPIYRITRQGSQPRLAGSSPV